jgi:hypothetical protein
MSITRENPAGNNPPQGLRAPTRSPGRTAALRAWGGEAAARDSASHALHAPVALRLLRRCAPRHDIFRFILLEALRTGLPSFVQGRMEQFSGMTVFRGNDIEQDCSLAVGNANNWPF